RTDGGALPRPACRVGWDAPAARGVNQDVRRRKAESRPANPTRVHNRRSVMAPRSLVTAPHGLATTSGLRILREGGNAVEAAIAAAATIAVVYPHMNAIGGGNIWLIYDAGARRARALMACGAAGASGTVQAYRAAGHSREIPRRGPLAANTVPGAGDGWWEAYEYSRRSLAGRRPLEALLADAVPY